MNPRHILLVAATAAAALLTGCATKYGSSGFTGGYKSAHVAEDVYRLSYGGNGYATRETIQTYWLYRACELTLEKGFDGFEILSPVALGAAPAASPFVKAQMIFIPMYTPPKPSLEADIRLLKAPISAKPPRVFDARLLKAELDPYVKGEQKCSGGNVCPHLKKYLQPQTPATALPAANAI